MPTRRQFLAHLGAIGLGLALSPKWGSVGVAQAAEAVIPRPEWLVFETVESGGLAHYSYFLGDKVNKVAMVIDPRRDVEEYLALAKQNQMTITHVLDTHIHADFLSGARELARRTGTVKICASVEGSPVYGFTPDVQLRHHNTVESGQLKLTALHTPGHTPEHMSFLGGTTSAKDLPWGVFTGDFLFIGSVGRPDLMGVENTDRLTSALFESVQSGYRGLPDELAIYPAHGPGSPCGAGIMKATGVPTLGQQRATNPYLRLRSEKSFADTLLFAQPPVPTYWPQMKVLNARGPAVLGAVPAVEMLSPKAFRDRLQNKELQLLDTRGMLDFAGGHIPGSVNIGHDPVMSLWGGWILDPKRPIALVLPRDQAAAEASAWLSRVGLAESGTVALQGGMKAWIDAGLDYDDFETMSVHQVRSTFPSTAMQLLDVRQPSEWDQGHIEGASYLFLPEIPKRLAELDVKNPVIVYCGNGYRASIAASLLRREGFDARSVPGSYTAWVAAGFPVKHPEKAKRASDTRRP